MISWYLPIRALAVLLLSPSHSSPINAHCLPIPERKGFRFFPAMRSNELPAFSLPVNEHTTYGFVCVNVAMEIRGISRFVKPPLHQPSIHATHAELAIRLSH